jgi:carbamoyltransferase
VVYSQKEVKKALKANMDQIKVYKANDADVLEKINNQKIVSVFGGGSESGRRALGNRSILADPRNSEMKAIINEKVKHRQWFRPVAPSILEEKVTDWFTENQLSPYMSFAVKIKEEKKKEIPAVVHFDGTARLQTVSRDISPWYHNFISQWEKLSGVPILINTSFNDSEPIVETPSHAINCFLNTEIEYLYFFDYGLLVEKIG